MQIEWQVENNDYCRKVLKKHWPKVPCHYDIKDIDWRGIPGVDVVCGGFPCQPFSLAGKRRGQADNRYLWPEVVRCLDALRPAWFLGENVPGIINLALDQVCTDLESLGYEVATFNIPACAVDAPHIRKRVWIVANSASQGLEGAVRPVIQKASTGFTEHDEWPTEPDVGRVVARIPARVDRLKGLGNAVVPQIVEAIGRVIVQMESAGLCR